MWRMYRPILVNPTRHQLFKCLPLPHYNAMRLILLLACRTFSGATNGLGGITGILGP